MGEVAREVGRLLGISDAVVKDNVVVGEQRLEVGGAVGVDRREVATEAVSLVGVPAQEPTLAEVWPEVARHEPIRGLRIVERRPEVGVESDDGFDGGEHAGPHVLAVHRRHEGVAWERRTVEGTGRVESGELQDRGDQIDCRCHRVGGRPADEVRVTDDERYVEVLVVDEVGLLAQPVRAGHLAVICGEDHDRVVSLPRCL